MSSIYSLQYKNRNKTLLLIFGFVGFVAAIFYLLSLYLGNIYIAFFGLGISLFQAGIAYYTGDKIALKMNGAQLSKYQDNPTLHNLVENISKTAGIPKPKVYISPDPSANAFATGRDPKNASVCVNQGLLNLLDKNELEAVLAHEIAHIKNRDILVMTVTAVLASVIGFIADIGAHILIWGGNGNSQKNPIAIIALILVIILAPIVALIIQMAVSRSREYLADASAVQYTRYPQGMISALEKLYNSKTPTKHYHSSTNHFFIAPPKKKFGEKFSGLFSTHPPLSERIEALRKHS